MIKSNLNDKKDGKTFYMNFHLKDGLGVEFTAYEGEMTKEGPLTSSTPYDTYRLIVPREQQATSHIRSRK